MAPAAAAWAAVVVALVAPHLAGVAVADFPVEVRREGAECLAVCPADTVQGGCPQAMDDVQYTSIQVDFIAVQVAQVDSPLFSSF